MTGYQKCGHALEHGDSARRATWVNRGARKIMAEGPDELTSVLTWTALAGVFVLLLVGATCLALSVESSARSAGAAGDPPASACAIPRRLCSSCGDQRAATGSRDGPACRTSGLTGLRGMSPDDVHYVFADAATVPRMAGCSVESALRATRGNGSRVNVFVVRDDENAGHVASGRSDTPKRDPVSLSTCLSELTAVYGAGRLNVVRVGLDECVECSPFRDALPDLRRRPGLVEFAARLTVLWQFGGTVLDPSVVAVRDRVYRANGPTVEYGHGTISAPAPCSASVYDAMVQCVQANCGAPRPDRRWRGPTFGPDAAQAVWTATAASPAPRWIVLGRGGAVGDPPHYYAETDRGGVDSFRGFCPTVLTGTRLSAADDG